DLLLHRLADRLPHPRPERFAFDRHPFLLGIHHPDEIVRPRQAAGMGGEKALGAADHRRPPLNSNRLGQCTTGHTPGRPTRRQGTSIARFRPSSRERNQAGPCEVASALSLAGASAAPGFGAPLATPTSAGRNTRSPIM